MFLATHTAYSPWITVNANDKKRARINIIRDILSQIEYEGKDDDIIPDSEIISMYHLNHHTRGD
jgi:predicted transcriptional regulator